MRKINVLGVAILMVFALGAIATGALAHEWLELNGKAITAKLAATTKGTLELKNIGIPALAGGGEIIVLCNGIFVGEVGLLGEDETKEVANLAGAEKNAVKCEVSKSTNTICTTGKIVTISPVNLPWATLLVSVGGVLNDESKTVTAGSKVGYSTTCGSITNKCESASELARLKANVAGGANFEFYEATNATCTVGKGLLKGSGIVEKFLAN